MDCRRLRSRFFPKRGLIWTALVWLVFQVCTSCWAQSENVAPWAQRIIEESSFDFGEVRLGSKATHTFKLQNPTDKELKIKSVSASCGCTIVDVNRQAIPPSEMGEITISLDTQKFRGKKTSTIHVLFEEPAEKEIQLTVLVDIRNLLVDPEPVEFRSVEVGQPERRSLSVSRAGSPYWKINEITSSSPDLTATIVGRKISSDQVAYGIDCVLLSSRVGARTELITITTNDSSQSEYQIPILIEVIHPVSVSQTEVFFDPEELNITKRILLRFKSPGLIREMQVPGEGWVVSDLPQEAKEVHLISITRDSLEAASGQWLIMTDQSDQPLEVDVIIKKESNESNQVPR